MNEARRDPLIEDLKTRIASGQAVLMVGAGVSLGSSNGAQAASWTGLLKTGVERCERLVGKLPSGWAGRVRAEIESGDIHDLLSAAEKVSAKLDEVNEFATWLLDTVGTLSLMDRTLIEALRELNSPIITTNYDDLIEQATGWPAVTWRQPGDVERVLRGDQRGIVHLHGHWKDARSVVLGLRSYDAFLRDPAMQAMLQAMRTVKTLVFVGFGRGLEDPNFRRLQEWAGEAFSDSSYRHYRLVLDGDVGTQTRDPFRDPRISAIPFGSSHAELAPFLGSLAPPKTPVPAGPTPERHNTRHLLRNLTDVEMQGRQPEVKKLLQAWRTRKTVVAAVVGPGGTGKTFVIREFLKQLRESRRRQPDASFGWSFPNQGQVSFEASAAGFVEEAVGHFGGKANSERPFRELAGLLRRRRCLLILDGVETLQDSEEEGGYFKQFKQAEGLGGFLHNICENGLPAGGLVVVSSKQPIRELNEFGGRYQPIEIGQLTPEDGAALLAALKVKGERKELKEASKEQWGNPLCLVILAGFLSEHGWTIRERHRFNLPRTGEYVDWVKAAIGAYASNLVPEERAFLRMLGLFGRSMRREDLDALRAGGAKVADLFIESSVYDNLKVMFARLARLHLLTPSQGGKWLEWDTHPLVRQHFAEELRDDHAEAWVEAHGILFEHYRKTSSKGPMTREELLPLFGALRHGCLAEEYQDAFEMYQHTIAKDWIGFDTEVAGMATEALPALSAFFQKGDAKYGKPVDQLQKPDQAWLLTRVSYCLETLGELKDAIQPRELSNRFYGELHNATRSRKKLFETARDAAYGSEVLALIQMRLGQLPEAAETAGKAVQQAQLSSKYEVKVRVRGNRDHGLPPVPAWLRECSTKSALGAVLHRQGRLADAAQEFAEACHLHERKCVPMDGHCEQEDHRVLHSEPGVRRCMLRLEMGEDEQELNEVLQYSDRMLKWSSRNDSDASDTIKGLHNLIRGMVLTELARVSGGRSGLPEAVEILTRAVHSMQDSRKFVFLCDVLLARAAALRQFRNIDEARDDLQTLLETSHRCEMALAEADAWVLLGHLELDSNPRRNQRAAREASSKARELVFGEREYPLCQPAVHLLEARLAHYDRRKADRELEAARASLGKVPVARLRRDFQRYESGDWGL
jgi:tetratricopeptide (TPR) repeat protein